MPNPNPAGFTPIRPNPFIVGNPVRNPAMFFGRNAEFELVRKRCQETTRGLLLVFCGERRSGKTSILFQITDGRLGSDFIPVLIDMQSMAITNEVDFLEKISDELLNSLGTEARRIERPEFAPGSNNAALFQRLVKDVLRSSPAKKLILLFDEYELFEAKIDAGVLGEDVLRILAHLMEDQSVFVIFTGSQHIENRRRDYWKIFLGKSTFKTISYLERDDALELIRRPVEGLVRYGEGTLEHIYRLTAGQPFYTQAVCQSLVDRLNEVHTNDASVETLHGVVEGLVNNPLPQMIFLWDGLERDEKLVLALLAESLDGPDAFSPANKLAHTIRQRDYPLDLTRSRIATALEKLFKQELLLKHDADQGARYAFRMDLWRLWIRRMHSVWQVMREEGLNLKARPWALWGRRLLIPASIVVVALFVVRFLTPKPVVDPRKTGQPPPTAIFDIRVIPEGAEISLDGRRVALGSYRDTLTASVPHTVSATADGYADSTFTFRLPAGGGQTARFPLRPRFGTMKVETSPPGAHIRIDDVERGTSPVSVSLEVPSMHFVEASMPGRGMKRVPQRVAASGTTPLMIVLEAGTGSLHISSDPAGA